jgi:hypothetical protein
LSLTIQAMVRFDHGPVTAVGVGEVVGAGQDPGRGQQPLVGCNTMIRPALAFVHRLWAGQVRRAVPLMALRIRRWCR